MRGPESLCSAGRSHEIPDQAAPIAELLMQKYADGTYDRVVLFYNKFKNAAVQIVTEEQYLPIAPAEAKEEKKEAAAEDKETKEKEEEKKKSIILIAGVRSIGTKSAVIAFTNFSKKTFSDFPNCSIARMTKWEAFFCGGTR